MGKCPKCGGIGGYEYQAKEVWVRGGGWGEESEGLDCLRLEAPKTVMCLDCKKRVPYETATQPRPAERDEES